MSRGLIVEIAISAGVPTLAGWGLLQTCARAKMVRILRKRATQRNPRITLSASHQAAIGALPVATEFSGRSSANIDRASERT